LGDSAADGITSLACLSPHQRQHKNRFRHRLAPQRLPPLTPESNTVTASSCAFRTVTVPHALSGSFSPWASTGMLSISPGLARPVRTPDSSFWRCSMEAAMALGGGGRGLRLRVESLCTGCCCLLKKQACPTQQKRTARSPQSQTRAVQYRLHPLQLLLHHHRRASCRHHLCLRPWLVWHSGKQSCCTTAAEAVPLVAATTRMTTQTAKAQSHYLQLLHHVVDLLLCSETACRQARRSARGFRNKQDHVAQGLVCYKLTAADFAAYPTLMRSL